MSELCLLDLLPPELVLEIVGHLNLDELARFSQASRSTYALVTESEQAIYRTAGYRLGLTNPQSAGSTAALVAPPAPTGAHRRQDELGSVVKRQQSISAHYDRVQNWKDFVRRAHAVRLGWQKARPVNTAIRFEQGSWFGDHGVHRFKLETGTRQIITTAEEGGLQVFDIRGNLVWHSSSPSHPHPHVEASGGYLATSQDEGNLFVIYRRSDITSPPSQLSQDQLNRLRDLARTEPEHLTPYQPFALIDPGCVCLAAKLRMPFFAAVAAGQTNVFVFNLLDATRQTVDISALGDPDGLADNRINYVELLGDHVLLAGSHSISAWHRAKGTVGLFPPKSPSVVINASPALQANAPGFWRNYGRRPAKWSAVHHDGLNLVAVSHGTRLPPDGRLLWTHQPGHAEDGSMAVRPEKTATLRLHATCVQLAVENGRAVVVTVHADLFCGLWLVDLADGATDGRLRPSAPKLVCFPLPCIVSPSRVEMTSDQIFFPATSALAPGGEFRGEYERLRVLAGAYTLPWEWHTLDGVELSAAPRGRMIDENGEFAQGWMDLMDDVDAAGAGTDCLAVLSFGTEH